MIDLKHEDLMPLAAARKHRLLRMSSGREPQLATVIRWIDQGVRGLKLEAVMKPSGLFTSEQAIERFIEQLTAAKFPAAKAETPKQRRAAIDRANAVLNAAGI